jgi:putative FmdB family regulatory protein
MPIMKYKCNSCDNEFPKLVFSPEDAPRQCPTCGSPDPKYVGEAFNVDEKDMIRRSCMSCDACGESMCGIEESS